VNGNEYDGCDDEWDNQFTTLKDYQDFTRAWLKECKRILKRNGSLWVIGGMQCIYTIGSIMQELGFWFVNDVIWAKKNPTPNFMGTRLNNSHETLIWAIKDQKYSYTFNYKTAKELNTDTVYEQDFAKGIRKQMGSVWRIGVCQGVERLKDEKGNKLHSTQKPEELLYRILAINSKINDIVLDPFGGTMTTGAVAKRMGRKYICIERDEKYCRFGQERINSVTPTIGDIEKATFDIRPPRVTFEEMIEAGYFNAGEKMFFNQKPYFFLTDKGKLTRPNYDEIDIHSAIAEIKGTKAKRLNGWDYWMVERNGELISIDAIRKQFLKDVKGYE
jgi:site-specific DNA-methyltransferase (adenine-specific)